MKTGYIAIIGRPNAGKSTLLNALIGEKVSAISHRPQTTQRSIHGILTDEERGYQMIFLDTPGIHEHGGAQYGSQKVYEINDRINSEAYASLRKADVILRLLDPTRAYGEEDTKIDAILDELATPIIRIETKQDILRNAEGSIKSKQGKKITQGKWDIIDGDVVIRGEEPAPTFFTHENIDLSIDSTTRAGFEALIDRILTHLPEGPFLYESDYYTDQPMDLRISEVIRERLFLELGEEIPYASYVEIEQIENDDPHLMKIHANIYVETDSQKVIVIGKGGSKIQKIGTESRVVLETIFAKRVFLALRVKVAKNWRKNTKILEKIFPRK